MSKYHNSRYQYLQPVFFAAVLVAGIYLGKYLSRNTSALQTASTEAIASATKVTDIVRYIEENYVDTVDLTGLSKEAIEGMLESLDPHSSYIPLEYFHEVNDPLQGKFEGIGIQFRIEKDTIMVLAALPGGPSEKVGIKAGDRIVAVDGDNVAGIGISNMDVVSRLKGERGTKVRVTVFRKGLNKQIDYLIVRDVIPTNSLDISYMVNKTTGYIKINKFAANTYDEFAGALEQLKEDGMEHLILDLRGNSGGYLQAAIDICDEFLKKGELIVYTKGRKRSSNYAYARKKGMFPHGELVVLIDEWSASASEIVAGAIQDNDRGVIVGKRSFGKGLVQEQMELPDGSALRLTVARYYTPSGRCIQEPYAKGVEDYYNKFHTRVTSQSDVPDTAAIADSLKFKTPSGKIVYGGGGIYPDYYVLPKQDSVYLYYNQLVNKGLIYRFAFDYVDHNRTVLKKKTATAASFLKSFSISDALFGEFIAYAGKSGVGDTGHAATRLKPEIETELKALIGRNLFGDEAFYPVLHRIDQALLVALDVLDNRPQRHAQK